MVVFPRDILNYFVAEVLIISQLSSPKSNFKSSFLQLIYQDSVVLILILSALSEC